eukprot:gene2096-1275_t
MFFFGFFLLCFYLWLRYPPVGSLFIKKTTITGPFRQHFSSKKVFIELLSPSPTLVDTSSGIPTHAMTALALHPAVYKLSSGATSSLLFSLSLSVCVCVTTYYVILHNLASPLFSCSFFKLDTFVTHLKVK